ncbi:LOW QUALITY PROTEIN: heterogeneous nuclear ribonucleoprotein R-like [Lytechinus variegatus]|uniref:heterogeneous nuclear ribonucleoprotein R-like n=1 Tax=Lytechinus variegatus TaxID=7654 RepID=UPI001BB1D7C4|nr:heterogeneous nuclear ribonucleoprotein R-like [Lytechinus variegatus]XP_041462944.1 LOW QUALITY PROTEIN: heterogeneous nuclear ribonucleoprotein R-like [Lytechinus variegatus]
MADNGDIKPEEMEQSQGDGGAEEPMETEFERTDKYDSYLGMGFTEKVASELDRFFAKGILSGDDALDDRAFEALKELDETSRLGVLKQFGESDLSHVTNTSAFLCGVIRTYRQKSRMKQSQGGQEPKGPDEAKIKEILARTGYSLDITLGQRKSSRPKPEDVETLPPPAQGSEIFIGKIPREMFEDELIPLLEQCGDVHDLRLMMDPLTGQNRGYAFAAFTTTDGAKEAVKKLNGYKVKENWQISVNISVPKSRLYVGSIPKNKTKEEILEEFSKVEKGLMDVIIYKTEDKMRNRGFAFLEFDSHKAAASAKRKLLSGRVKVWNQINVNVDWADPVIEPDSETMSKVKVVYIRNLSQESTEAKIKEDFGQYGEVEKAKKMKDYCFVHFKEREAAVKAIEEMNGKEYEGTTIEVSLAKPPQENKKKKERIMRQQNLGGFGFEGYSPRGRGGPQGGHRGRGSGYGGGDRYRDYGGYEGYDDGYYGGYGGGYGGGRYEADSYGYGEGYDGYYGGGAGYGRGRGNRARGRGMGIRGGPSTQRGFLRGGGARGGPRGGRGGPRGGRGNRGGRGGRGGNMGGKRKLEGQLMGDPKRRNTQSQWGTQPIAQQPLDQGYGYSDYNNFYDDQWSSDNYGAGSWK